MKTMIVAVILALLAFAATGVGEVKAQDQDCEHTIKGNTNSPCKGAMFANLQPPIFTVERFPDGRGDYYCRGVITFPSEGIGSVVADARAPISPVELGYGGGNIKMERGRGYPAQSSFGSYFTYSFWGSSNRGYVDVQDDSIRFLQRDNSLSEKLRSASPIPESIYTPESVRLLFHSKGWHDASEFFPTPQGMMDYNRLANQCVAGIIQQLENDATAEAARQQAEANRIAVETQAAEAQAEAERAAVELQSAQDTLTAAQTLADARRAQTILAIKHEDSIRAIWQQVMEVRLVGLEERTNIWKEAVARWEAEDLQFSKGMQARIQEVERLQALNLALEQSMADQRRVLIAQLEVLEKQEQDQMETRGASFDTSQAGTN